MQSQTFKRPQLTDTKEMDNYKKRLANALEHLKYIVHPSNSALINVFRLDSTEGKQDIELSILRALLNCK